ncbi:transcriptional regulator, SARP family [Catenulispora acidiphila DSM 44928]|uniref:Transcriptional regulator, SARP family n=1 Tax=Catenulispora acidiphila (strain DSM 44928 / JCM 14897 / NBRC 102108 / NRRL B-24433 / ID139908) TaxID=479433 RepID=C7Q3G0_CATAD|nr:BTAD domain-containing putative transcriptional regulator [Catenulispora acidiphila]ACU75725.1 transcriptional regulator, SARP family [Catenulispora acidiphila DSM 44928]
MNLIARLSKAAFSLALTAGLSCGVPWLLLTYIGSPVPKQFPGLHEIVPALSARFDIHVFITIIVYLLWACWAVLVVQLLVQVPGTFVDIVRILRRREPVRRGAAWGPGGALARGLIAAFTIALLAPRAADTAAAAAKATGYVLSPTAKIASVAPAVPGARSASGDDYVVRSGDTLWDIAALHLGEPERWHDIYSLNVGRVQPDGGVLSDPQLIQPGWQLRLPENVVAPASAVPAPAVSTTRPSNAGTVLVPEPVETPSLIAAGGSPAASAIPSRAEHPIPAQRIAPRDRAAVRLPGGGVVPVSLASGVAAALALARLRTRARSRIQPVDAPGDSEPLAPLLEPVRAELLRAHHATVCAPGKGLFQDDEDFGDDPFADDEPLPSEPESASVTEDALWSLKSEPGTPLTTPEFAPSLRAVLDGADAPDDVHVAICGNSPIPLASVTTAGLGLTGDGAADAARSLLVSALAAGGPRAIDQAVEVQTTVQALSVLLGPGALTADSDRLTVFDSLTTLLDDAEREQSARAAEVAEYGQANAADVRRFDNVEPFRPRILLVHLEAGERHRLEAIARAGGKVDTHLVLLGPWAAGTSVTIGADRLLTATGPDAELLRDASAFGITMDEAEQILSALGTAAESPATREPFTDTEADGEPPVEASRQDESVVPSAATPDDTVPVVARAHVDQGVLLLKVIGPFTAEIDGRDVTGCFNPSHRTLLLYLALRERPVRRAEIIEALWTDDQADGKNAEKKRRTRFDTRLYQTKKALADAVGHDSEFISSDRASGFITLNRTLILTDLACFDQLVGRASRAADDAEKTAHLEAACALYRGPLDESIRGDWLLEHREDRLRRYRDAAGDLARIVGRTDPDRGLAILNQLLEHDLFNEDLYRRIMRGQARLGRHDAVRRTFNLLETRFEAVELVVDASTRALVRTLTRNV